MSLSAAASAAAFSAEVTGRGSPACGAASPAFILKGISRDTVSLGLAERDRDAPLAPATMLYAGHGAIPKGALAVTMPCLSTKTSRRTIWTSDAFDAKGVDLDMTEGVADDRR